MTARERRSPCPGRSAPDRSVDRFSTTAAVDLGDASRSGSPRPRRHGCSASWGSAPNSLGLLSARSQATIGPSAFDVAADGSVVVLDQVNRRLATYARDGAAPRYSTIPFAGGEGDIAVGADGVTYVLDSVASAPVVRAFAPGNSSPSPLAVAASGADMVRTGPSGAYVHGYPGRCLASRDPARRSAVCGGPGRGGNCGTIAGRWSARSSSVARRPPRSSPSYRAITCCGAWRVSSCHATRGDPARGALR